MLKVTIAAILALTAAPVPPATHDVWEADIEVSSASPVFLLQLDDQLSDATKTLTPDWIEVIDAQGRTMPRGFWEPWSQGLHQDVALALTHKREQRARPQVCETPKHPPECATFDREPDFSASLITMAGRVARMPMLTSSYAGSVRVGAGGARSMQQSNYSTPPPIPLRYDVFDTAAPAAAANDWTSRTLVLKWKSRLPPTSIAWQIGFNVAEVTPSDRALLDEDNASSGEWNARLSRAWHRFGRMIVFSTLDAKQNDDGSWQAEVALKGLVGNTALQIATAPVGAADLVDVHLRGVGPRTSPRLPYVTRSMQLSPLGEKRWKVIDAWPKNVFGVGIGFTLEQSRAIMESRLETMIYQTQSASGQVKTTTIQPYQTLASEVTLNGIGAGLTFDKTDPFIELQQLSPAQPLPQPQLTASYQARTLWFDNVGKPPYRLTIGTKSARRPDQMSNAESELLGNTTTTLTAPVQLPLGTLRNAHKTGTFTEAATGTTTQQMHASDDSRLAAIIALIATLAVAALAMFDHSIRAKIAALRDDAQ